MELTLQRAEGDKRWEDGCDQRQEAREAADYMAPKPLHSTCRQLCVYSQTKSQRVRARSHLQKSQHIRPERASQKFPEAEMNPTPPPPHPMKGNEIPGRCSAEEGEATRTLSLTKAQNTVQHTPSHQEAPGGRQISIPYPSSSLHAHLKTRQRQH